jgi:hypothetical protein
MDLSEIGVNVVDWIGLAQDRYRWRALVNSGSIKCRELPSGCTSCGLSSGTQLHRVSYILVLIVINFWITQDFNKGKSNMYISLLLLLLLSSSSS